MHGRVDRADEEIAAANYPQMRMFLFRQTYSVYELPAPPDSPLADREGEWVVCSPETVARFSATAYFFGRDLFKELGAPIGLINSSVGGTPIEAWTSLDAQRQEPALHAVLDEWQQKLTGFDAAGDQQKYLDAKAAWLKARAAAQKAGQPAPKAPTPFKNLRVMAPGGLFDGMIAPLAPYAIRGVIWYQGERNADDKHGGIYGTQLEALIRDWRARWDTDFYFAWVQLPGFKNEQRLPSEPNGWGVGVREGMRQALRVPHTGMAITIDLGGVTAGHPTNKADFAGRLSRLALHDVYGRKTGEWSGPLYKSAQVAGKKMVLVFEHAAGLKAALGELKGFAIAGPEQKFVWASTEIAGDKVTVWSDRVPEPAAVRYGWASNPNGNLVNAADLPASPFRTDDWK
jgi:sialate O-acetylesterase